jgi:RNA polymerase sigma factor (sigma-70 family)
MPGGETDSDLIRRSRAQPSAFAEIFDRHHDELYRYLRRRTGSEAAADLASETFVTAFARRSRYRAQGDSALPWLYGIATNLLHNHSRRERRQVLAFARHGAIPDADHAAAGAYADAETRSDITRALAGLAAPDRDALLLYAWADLSYEDIAVAQGVPIGTVRSRLNRARRVIRDAQAVGVWTETEVAGGQHG